MKFKYITLIVVLFFSQLVTAQNYELKASLSKNRIIVGDTLSLKLEIEVSDNQSVQFPLVLDTISKGIEIAGEARIDSLTENGVKKYTKTYIISAYDSAMYVFGHLKVMVQNQNSIDTIYSNELTLFADYQQINEQLETKIDTSLTEKIIKNKANIETPFSWEEFWVRLKIFLKKYWYFVLAGIILIVFGFYWYYKIRKKSVLKNIEPKIVLKPHVEAFDNLDKLADKKLWQKGKVKEYYSELSYILRLYLERQFKIIALESTTDIISTQLKYYKHTSTELEKDIHSLLQLADYVKFAKYQALPAENQKAIERAYAFVEQTRPKELQTTELQTENTEQK